MKKILVVEDDAAILLALKDALTEANYSVFTESDGEIGLKRALEIHPDLVLLDVMLPSKDGFQICSELKKGGAVFPIFMLTSMSGGENKIDGLNQGADDYITKPFIMKEVLLRIRNALDRTGKLRSWINDLEKDLKKIKEKVAATDQLKSEFLSIVSHEIRTPINVILGNLYLLKEELEDKLSEEQIDSLEIVDQESRRLIRTVDSIILISELKQGTYTQKIEEINFENLIQELLPQFKNSADTKEINVNFINNYCGAVITGDRYTILQMLSHLIDNAVKFTERGGVEISLFKNIDGKICVSVSDTGIGISESFLPKLFEPFTQEDSGYSKKFEGNGLGLALVLECCKLNNAQIKVNSVKGEGSVFTAVFD